MKKSNKILLAGFLVLILLISAIHIGLYAKYKNGNYTIYNSEAEQAKQPMQLFPNILFVSMSNVSGASVKFSDVAGVEKMEYEGIQYVRSGDTLLIKGKYGRNHPAMDHEITFNLPYNATLSVMNSFLYFKPGKKIAETNPVIYLKKSQVFFSGVQSPFNLGHVRINASDSSAALFHGKTQVNNLEVELSNSSIEYGEGNFGQLSILTDSISRISLQSKHLMRANIKTVARE